MPQGRLGFRVYGGLRKVYAMTCGAYIRAERKKAGLTLLELGKRSGLGLSQVSDLETGRRRMSARSWVRLTDALDIGFGIKYELWSEQAKNELYQAGVDLYGGVASEGYLTPRQLEVLEFIRDTIARLGYAPTLREIAEEFGFSSTASAQKHIALLQKKGYLHRDKNQKRGLVVLV